MKKSSKFQISRVGGGYTLIELIIVSVVIGALATLFIVNYPASQQRARDTRRRNDIKQYQTALEGFANRNNGNYPVQTTAAKPSTLCATLGLPSPCLEDPRDGTSSCISGVCIYQYVTDISGTSYGLWARLERPQNTPNPLFVVCSSGVAKEGSTAPTSVNTCP